MDVVEGSGSTFLKADEVDEAGLFDEAERQDNRVPGSQDLFGNRPPLDTVAQHEHAQVGDVDVAQHNVDASAQRPPLRRDQRAPPPQQPPPPAPPPGPNDADNTQDSLSLVQLRRLVADMPKSEAAPYAFRYRDTSTFREELEELFGYSADERATLLEAQRIFDEQWEAFITKDETKEKDSSGGSHSWMSAPQEWQTQFFELLRSKIESSEESARREALGCLIYTALGCWGETAGLQDSDADEDIMSDEPFKDGAKSRQSQLQLSTIKVNVRKIGTIVGVAPIYEILRAAIIESGSSNSKSRTDTEEKDFRRTLWSCLTLLCIFVDLARREDKFGGHATLRNHILELQPQFLKFLTDYLADMRWDEYNSIPPSKMLILYWKTIILFFGGTDDVEDIKASLAKNDPTLLDKESQTQITASPLDYHVFRQEIISKYPSFDPPKPLFPFDPESSSMLPSSQDPVKQNSNGRPVGAGPANINGSNTSIIHQPVHIATPAPSPPPSPAGQGGKGIKKQNYQTNQMFPFLYPPLDDSSNDLGGKGGTAQQDLLVGRKWDGSDIPASILEAAELFAKRMRATRGMKQLWEERVEYMKYDRGYSSLGVARDGSSIGTSDSEDSSREERQSLNAFQRDRLLAVETFYKDSLPRLQSLVMVLLKVLLQTITILVTQPSLPTGFGGSSSPDRPINQKYSKLQEDSTEPEDSSVNEVDVLRTQEIMGKAVSGILLLLLKWFKLSHVLKAEYLSQLLMDSNYVQLMLKLFTHQELERVVNFNCEMDALNFFAFCRAHSVNKAPKAAQHGTPEHSDGDDDAVPPPIRMHRANTSSEDQPAAAAPIQPPEVDELGYPTSDIPNNTITNFSWRAFFTNINHLRILQKIVKAKPHRQLAMVHYKFSNVLKKALKVPQPDIRLYTLKIIKGQVPYCHRKWRQSNMRIITAIYLHCRPSLRDEWLAGIDVDQEVGEALPAEQALRSLTYWYNLRHYPDQMGLAESQARLRGRASEDEEERARENGKRVLEDEQDFFLRELERMDIGLGLGVASGSDEVDPLEGHGAEEGEEMIKNLEAPWVDPRTGLRGPTGFVGPPEELRWSDEISELV